MASRQDRSDIAAQDERERALLSRLFDPRAWLVTAFSGAVVPVVAALVVALRSS